MADHKERFKIIIQKLRDNGCKITPQRMAIVEIVAKSEGHPSVENIHDQIKRSFPTMSLATVYKNILLLKSFGEVLGLVFLDGSNRYDGNRPDPHPHAICVRCKKIVDSNVGRLDEMKKEVELDTNFKIINHRLEFFGICSSCVSKF